jgi:hypothetical protein
MNEELAQQTYVHPVIALAMLVTIGFMFALPRRKLIVPFVFGGVLIPMDQILVVGPLHFPMIRVLVLFAWIRIFMAAKASGATILPNKFSTLDRVVLLYAVFDALDYIILFGFSAQAIINRLGAAYMVIGIYFLMRACIRDERDILLTMRSLAYVSALVALIMLVEHVTKQNPYGYIGGSRAWTRDALMVRDSKLRAMGPFQHPVLAGAFGGVCLPFFLALWIKREKFCASLGILSSTVIVLASASSTPIMAYVFGLFGFSLWRFRRYMHMVRWGIVCVLVGLQLVMKAPVWALIQRVDVVGGSSGFHRFNLVDQTIRHFWDWWLFGVKDTYNWGPDLWDHANQYVAVATNSGFVPLCFFIAILVFGFKLAGRARRSREDNPRSSRFVWALNAALLAHLVAFFGISYVDQTVIALWGVLAMIQVAGAQLTSPKTGNRSRMRIQSVHDVAGPLPTEVSKRGSLPLHRLGSPA